MAVAGCWTRRRRKPPGSTASNQRRCGDHAYPSLLGHPLYTQEPVRYLAALDDKPWRPCAWHFQHTWDTQMKLARQVGAGVGVSNGCVEYTGLVRLPADVWTKMLADIGILFEKPSTQG
jgi:hypothetical protein